MFRWEIDPLQSYFVQQGRRQYRERQTLIEFLQRIYTQYYEMHTNACVTERTRVTHVISCHIQALSTCNVHPLFQRP